MRTNYSDTPLFFVMADCEGENEAIPTLPTPLPREIVEEAHGGYDCAFVDPPPALVQTECPICLLILKQPCLTSCCGCKVCQTCIDGVRKRFLPCPNCNKGYFTIMREQGLERTLKELEVVCSYKEYGCNWTGRLGHLETHLDCDQSPENQVARCECVAVECTYQCGDWFQRRDITVHQNLQCRKRPYACEHCEDYQSTFEDVTEIHHPECYKYPVACPNSCQVDLFERQDLEDHLDEYPLTVIDCPFIYAGCEVELPRREMPEHMSCTVEHLLLLGSVTRTLMEENQELRERAREYDDHESVTERFRQTNTAREEELQESIAELELRVRVSEDKLRENEETVQELLQQVQESADRNTETADELQQRLSVSEIESHRSIEMIQELEQKVGDNKDEMKKVTDELRQHIEKMNRLYKQKQRTIEEEVKNLKEETQKLKLQKFGLPLDFHIEKRNETIYLPTFCTHPHGYQMCVRVDPDGHGRGKGTHISIFTYIMQGPFDNYLKWPFHGVITIQIKLEMTTMKRRLLSMMTEHQIQQLVE